MTEIASVEQMSAGHLRRGVAQRVRRLRLLIDTIEAEAEGNIRRAEAGKGTYAIVVADFVREFEQGVSNLHVSILVTTAADADIAHAKGE